MFHLNQLLFRLLYFATVLETVSSSNEKMFIVKIEVKDVYKNCAGTVITEHPELGAMKDVYSNCAGTIVTEQAVLTAAHCVHRRKDVSVIQFTPDEIHKHEVDAILVHPDFDCLTFFNDIALVKIKAKFHKPWRPIIINDAMLRSSLNAYDSCKMVGWLLNDDFSLLKTENNKTNLLDNSIGSFLFEEDDVTLTRVPVNIITGAECSKKIENFGGNFAGEEKLCGIYSEERSNLWCSIGSGGPLLCPAKVKSTKMIPYQRNPAEVASNLDYERIKYLGVNGTLEDPLDLLVGLYSKRSEDEDKEYQIAVVSWGKICSKVPSTFVRTDTSYKWIKETVENFENNTSPLVTYSSTFGTTSKSVSSIQSLFSVYLLVLVTIAFH